jgi:hypothetical protein
MLKKIILLSACLGIPTIMFIATKYGTTPPITFEQSVKMLESAGETESAKKVLIRGYVLADATHAIVREGGMVTFIMRDDAMREFRVQYDGQDAVGTLENMQKIGIAGHAHGGEKPYFHAKQILLNY